MITNANTPTHTHTYTGTHTQTHAHKLSRSRTPYIPSLTLTLKIHFLPPYSNALANRLNKTSVSVVNNSKNTNVHEYYIFDDKSAKLPVYIHPLPLSTVEGDTTYTIKMV